MQRGQKEQKLFIALFTLFAILLGRRGWLFASGAGMECGLVSSGTWFFCFRPYCQKRRS